MLKKFIKSQQRLLSMTHKSKYTYFNQPQNFDPAKDYYRILQLNKGASDAQIKKAYYKFAKQYHPDVSKGYQTRFKEISQAYEVLSNPQTKQQYESARTFREGWSKMGSKAQQGSYSYEQYQDIFRNMSSEERQQFQRQAKAKLRRIGMAFAGFFIFWIIFSRTPHKAYTEFNGTLIPIDNMASYHYPDQYLQQPGLYPQGQSNNPYVNMPYQPPGTYPMQPQVYHQAVSASPVQSYGSQYPQSQYIPRQNEFVQQQPVPYTQQQYSAIPQQAVQPKSQYTIQRPQPHQPYPNSPYAEKPIQSNYQPGFKSQAPNGLQD